MRLKFIKLAGFKSFVEPTKVSFEQQITAVVGPNGCGKSNIIDAVRWVLGESSAKNLRGEAMTDVIFNGAASRKPIGQASVELFFDNVAGRLTGSMADRNEISIRRLVNRDSNNIYYLNGSKCRRKDITDIFLGTGLGPRSYAIIEQGTISKLIESKPQELRVFIEEAAGISKYKERRRETETRIRHTRENLQRLNDIRSELSDQINRLQQQAQDAKHFKKLKNQERNYKAELAVLHWQKYNQQAEQAKLAQDKHQQKIAQYIASHEEQRLCIAENKQKLQASQEHINQLQQQQLRLSNNIARAELHLKHGHERQAKMQQELQAWQQQLVTAQHSLLAAQTKFENSGDLTITINLQLDHVEQQINALTLIYQRDVLTQQNQQAKWQEIYQQQANSDKEKLLSIKNIAEQELIIAQAATRLSELDSLLASLLDSLSKPDQCTAEKKLTCCLFN
jgi:chromosome segregation protein